MRKILLNLFIMALLLFSNPAYAAQSEEHSGTIAVPVAVETETKVEKKQELAPATDMSVEKVDESMPVETSKHDKETATPNKDNVPMPLEVQKAALITENGTGKTDADPAPSPTEESKKSEPATREEKTSAVTETDGALEKVEEKSDKTAIEDEEVTLKEGTTLDAKILSETPVILGGNSEGLVDSATPTVEVLVSSFEKLKAAIENAPEGQATTIVIDSSFELTEKLTIKKGQIITLTAKNTRLEKDKHSWEKPWDPITQPADVADEGEDKQREVIKEARRRGDEAIQETEAPLPDENKGDIIIKRAKEFVKDSLFNVLGKLTLGTEDSAIYIDGNSDVQTALDDRGTVINVDNGGKLTMKNAVIMNSKNGHGYTGPIKVKEGGSFTMDGGRISNNTSNSYAGAVYVNQGGSFTLNNGLIDNNSGSKAGGIFFGSRFDSKGKPAIVNIKGGIIAKNNSVINPKSSGGLTGFPNSILNIDDGIVAGNQSSSGGLSVNYGKHLKENKAEANINGGLIYKNYASGAGGGVYVDTNFVNFNKTMILDNCSKNIGGGIYVSLPPSTQILKGLLVTENTAKATWFDQFGGGNGGGLWNCPTGYVHIGDGHTLYVFDNNSDGPGQDITFSKKIKYFLLNGENIKDKFYSHISPVTKDGSIIKFLEDGKTGVDIPEHMSYTDLLINLRAEYNVALRQEAWKNANTFILGNTSRNGGGIGSNANLETPEDEGDYDLKVRKKWDSTFNKELENSVTAEIFIVPMDKDEAYVRSNYGSDPNLYKYGEITLSKDNNWEGQIWNNPYAEIDGLPAKLKDKGLPFTAEELAKRGLKYLVMEKGDKYFSEVTEIKAEDKKDVEVGQIDVERIASKDLGTDYDDPEKWPESKIYLYKYDSKNERLMLLDQSKINADSSWKAILKSPDLLSKISKIEYYGTDRVFTEYGEDWIDQVKGYHSENGGYALVLHENEDGSLTLRVPYLWIQDYDNKSTSGFDVKQLNEKTTLPVGTIHEFIITNYEYGKLDVTKDWKTKLDDEKLPESIKLYLLLDGKKVIDSYDEEGNPIYKFIELTKKDGWKGSFQKLDPKGIAQGRYSLEEDELNNFVPKIVFVPTEDKLIFRIKYADKYGPIDGGKKYVFTNYHFKDFRGDIKINLIIDGKKFDSQYFVWSGTQLNKEVVFGQEEKNLILPLNGKKLRIDSYDLETNEPGLTEYNFYIKKDQNGFYTLYVPRLIIDGVPYDLFNVTKTEAKEDGLYPKEIFVEPQEESMPKVEVTNYDGPNHEIEFLKEWINGRDKIPEEITLVLTDKTGNKTEIKLTKKDNWTKTLSDLEGILKDNKYSVAEIEVDNFTSEISQEKTGVVIKGEDKEGEEISFNYESKELNEALSSGKYRYRIFELEDKSIEFNQENLDKFIRVEKQEDGSYIIYFADTVSLTERLSIKAKNSHNPPEEPPETPEEPPETPEEPPEEPPETPEEPPVTPPEEPPVTPPEEPTEVPSGPPKTFDPGIAGYALTGIASALAFVALGFDRKKKRM